MINTSEILRKHVVMATQGVRAEEITDHRSGLQTALHNIQGAAQRLELADDLFRRIVEPAEQISIRIHPMTSDGRMLHAVAG